MFHLTNRRSFFARIGQIRINIRAIRRLVTSAGSCSKQSYFGSKQAPVVDRGLLQIFCYQKFISG